MYIDDFSRNNWYKSVESNDYPTRIFEKKKKKMFYNPLSYYPLIVITYHLLSLLSNHRCLHGAKCSPSSNFLDFACTCTVGYTGRLCDEDVDECVMTSPCRNGATCRNTNGSYQCLCAKGYEGRDCIINTDDCASCKYRVLTYIVT